jgi:hypothetical protein
MSDLRIVELQNCKSQLPEIEEKLNLFRRSL